MIHEKIAKKVYGTSRQKIFDVILDVNSYKTFLPYCLDSKVFYNQKNNMFASVVIGFEFARVEYLSDIKYNNETFEIVITNHKNDKNFNFLRAIWNVSLDCEINFEVSFQLNNFILNQIAKRTIKMIALKCLNSFISRVLES